jgi:hypothetical protein
MDKSKFELLLRQTPFCEALLAEAWDSLSTKDRIELLLQYSESDKSAPKGVVVKALIDANPLVRMLGARVTSFFFERDNPEMQQKLLADTSPFVKSTLHVGADPSELNRLSQFERLGAIALSNSINVNEESFANFITSSLQSRSISEEDAAELVIEFVRNPKLKTLELGEGEYFEDGLTWHTNLKQFEAIWNLTTCTPRKVHKVIAWEYPLKTGQLYDTIPEDLLYRMSEEALEALIWREHKPLLDLIEKNPDRFKTKIHDVVRESKESLSSSNHRDKETEPIKLFEALREELQQRLDEIDSKITQILSKRKGLFS